MFKIKKILLILISFLLGASTIAIPIFAINNVSAASVSFNSNKIGIYIEKAWTPAYEIAIEEYNKLNHHYEIELKEKGAFDALDLITQLGVFDDKIPDLIYMPLDRIASLVQDQQALMGFKQPQQLLKGIDSKVYDDVANNLTLESFAKKGAAKVRSVDGNLIEYYFGIAHATEALIMFYKGDKPINKTIDDLIKDVNDDNWASKMLAFKFNDLWHALGVISGFVKKFSGESASINGQNIGRLLLTANQIQSKFQSNVTKINNVDNTDGIQQVSEINGWTGGAFSTIVDGSKALQQAINWIAKFYKQTVSQKNQVLGSGKLNDWLLSSSNSLAYGEVSTALFKNNNIKNGYIIDGPWAKSSYENYANGAVTVPQLTNGVDYIQAPGGWMYGINQRNFNNYQKVEDIKTFINVLLTNPRVIRAQYDYAGKIIDGAMGKYALTNSSSQYAVESDFDKSILEAVFNSKKMDSRPDGGNIEFSLVWGTWDEKGWRSEPIRNQILKNSDISEQELKSLREKLVISFQTMINGLQEN